LHALGVRVVRAPSAALLWWAAARARFARGADGRLPFWIPAGGASPLGALGAVRGGLELAADVRAGRLPPPDRVVVAAGSCGAAAGLLVGTALGGLRTEIVAVRVTPRVVASRSRIMALARGALRAATTAARAGDPTFTPLVAGPLVLGPRLVVEHGRYGAGYAEPSSDVAALTELAATDGVRLEPTYTAKAFGAALAPTSRGKVVVFWNTFAGVSPSAAVRAARDVHAEPAIAPATPGAG
jgi:D-cysteine desulfhydrase